jgi:hypothetical protein
MTKRRRTGTKVTVNTSVKETLVNFVLIMEFYFVIIAIIPLTVRKSTVDDHLNSITHKNKKQQTIDTTLSSSESKKKL